MKITPLLLAPLFSLALFLAPARAEEPAPVNLTPEMQAMLAELLKSMAQSAAQAAPEAAPVPEPAPVAPTAPAASPRETKPPLGSMSNLRTGGLTTSNLTGASLAPSASLGGRGTTGGVTRLNNNEWRLLFPARDDRR
jgi:hypothetical protein